MYRTPPSPHAGPRETRVKYLPDRGPLRAKEGYHRQLYSGLLAQWVEIEYLGLTLDNDTIQKEQTQ